MRCLLLACVCLTVTAADWLTLYDMDSGFGLNAGWIGPQTRSERIPEGLHLVDPSTDLRAWSRRPLPARLQRALVGGMAPSAQPSPMDDITPKTQLQFPDGAVLTVGTRRDDNDPLRYDVNLKCPINIECRICASIAPPHLLLTPEHRRQPIEAQHFIYFAEVLGTYTCAGGEGDAGRPGQG